MHHDKEIIGYRHNAAAQILQLYLNIEETLTFCNVVDYCFQAASIQNVIFSLYSKPAAQLIAEEMDDDPILMFYKNSPIAYTVHIIDSSTGLYGYIISQPTAPHAA